MEQSKERRGVVTGICEEHIISTCKININPLNENCRLSTETEIFVVFAWPEESPRYKIQLEIVWGFWAGRCEPHQSKSSFMFLWDQSQPGCHGTGQLCLCQTIPLLTLLHFRKPQIKCERGATGGMIPRVCGETDVWCANTELEQALLSPRSDLWKLQKVMTDGFFNMFQICALWEAKSEHQPCAEWLIIMLNGSFHWLYMISGVIIQHN